MNDLVRFIKEERAGESGIIYCRLRVTCDRVSKALECEDIDVAVYHAGLDHTKRNKVQSDWSAGGARQALEQMLQGTRKDCNKHSTHINNTRKHVSMFSITCVQRTSNM